MTDNFGKRFGYQSLYHMEWTIRNKKTGEVRRGLLNLVASCTSKEMGVLERILEAQGYYEDDRWLVHPSKQ